MNSEERQPQEKLNNSNIKRQVLFGFAILIVVLVIVLAKRTALLKAPIIESLPKFDVTDDLGRPIGSASIKNKFVYIQFLANKNDLEILKGLYNDWQGEKVAILAVGDKETAGAFDAVLNDSAFHLITKEKDRILSAFSNLTAGSYFIYDLSGRLAARGKSDDNIELEANKALRRIVKNEYFRISELLGPGGNSLRSEWFSQVIDFMKRENKNQYLIAMFNGICQGCNSGSVVRLLNDVHREKKDRIGVLCLVDGSFTERDIRTLKSQLGIEYATLTANTSLSEKWKGLANKYSPAELNEIVFVVDSEGRVLRTMDPNCGDCARKLTDYLRGL